jgi:alpha-beta hydrolase superfamily lysophospholipase
VTEHLVEKPDPDLAWLDRPEVVRVLFYPRREPPNRPTPLRVRRVSFPVADGIEIHGRLHRAKLDGPTILLFHGNGEIAADYDGISPLYSEWGINLLVVDYRGYGNSDGQPNASHLLADAVAVFNQVSPLLVAHGLRARPLFIMGRSLGSAPAIEIGWRAAGDIDGLIIESGFARTLPLLVTLGLRSALGEPDEARRGFGNLDKIANIQTPTLVIHGQDDRLVPVANGHALYTASGADEKRLVIIPDAGHNDLLFVGQGIYFQALRDFLLSGE